MEGKVDGICVGVQDGIGVIGRSVGFVVFPKVLGFCVNGIEEGIFVGSSIFV